ncbi:MAG TPA: response regulator [Bacteroides sp.]|nr:response regulator [Bacteroides sp.]
MSSKFKILYVDDESINLKLFEINFSEKYEVHTAPDGFSGLTSLNDNPDILVIISDMKMPNMNGIEFIKKAKEKFPDKKFFILTGFEITEEILNALETGLILRYFSKPFNLNEIDSAISEAIGSD